MIHKKYLIIKIKIILFIRIHALHYIFIFASTSNKMCVGDLNLYQLKIVGTQIIFLEL